LSVRLLRSLAALPLLLILASCAGTRAVRHFPPASAQDVREALDAWGSAQERASRLPAARLLYDAHMGSRAMPSVPGTLAVSYDGQRVLSASLTGPFGSRIADYAEGSVKGQDQRAFVVDPDALRAVLAGVWPGALGAVAGCDGGDCLLTWETPYPVEAVLDVKERRFRSLRIRANGGDLAASYSGAIETWPQRIALKEARSGRSLTLDLLGVESGATKPASGR
jgi:hypothetical protein